MDDGGWMDGMGWDGMGCHYTYLLYVKSTWNERVYMDLNGSIDTFWSRASTFANYRNTEFELYGSLDKPSE